MNETEIQALLDRLAGFQAQKDALELKKKELIEAVLTPEIKAQLAEIDAEFAPDFEAADKNYAELKDVVEAEVKALGKSVKGKFLFAVWNKGRAGGWDTAKLEGMAELIPEIKTARKPDGEPTVSFRAVK